MSTMSQRIETLRISTENLAIYLVVISAALLCLPTQARSAEPLRIGLLLSLSGTMEQKGREALRRVRMSNKLRTSVLGRPVRLVVANAQSDPAQAACAMFRLIERDSVSAVIGDVISSTSMAASHIAEWKHVPMIAGAGVSDRRCGHSSYFFPIDTHSKREAFLAARLCRERLSAETAVVVTDIAQELSIELAETFIWSFVHAGGRILGNIRIRTGETTFSDTLSRIAAAKPDAVYAPVSRANCILLAKQIHSLGLFMPIVSDVAIGCETVTELDPRTVKGIYVVSCRQGSMSVVPGNKLFPPGLDAMAAGSSLTPARTTAQAYCMLLDAIERAGSAEPEAIREALVTMRDEESQEIAKVLHSKQPHTGVSIRLKPIKRRANAH